MRIIFAGTPDFAAASLAALLSTEHDICAVYTQPDRPAGRGRKLTPSPVKQLALQHHIPVEQPENFKAESDRSQLSHYQADVMIVVAYGLLLPQSVLDIPHHGCLNVHASLLPRWRGAAPIQRAILAGDTETGVCIMQMEAGLDTGPVLEKAVCPISPKETAQTLHDKLAALGAETLINTLTDLAEKQLSARVQDHTDSTYAKKLDKQEATINWQQAAVLIDRQIRAFNPWPVAQTTWQDQVIRIWSAELQTDTNITAQPGEICAISKVGMDVSTGSGVLRITELQLPGKRRMQVSDMLNAHKFTIGDYFG